MNTLISTNLDQVSSQSLSPTRRGAQVRMLFISSIGLGFKRYYEQLIHYAGADPDITAVHIGIRHSLAVKLFCATIPLLHQGGWDQKSLRYHLAWWPILRRWFRGPLSLEHFDVVHLTHGIGYGMVGLKKKYATKFAVNVDVTAVQDWRELGYSRIGRQPMVAVEREIYDEADLVVCRNRWCCQSVREDFGIPEQRTHIALSSLALTSASATDSPRGGPVRMVFVGHQFDRKGGPEILKLHQERFADRAQLHVCTSAAQPPNLKNVIWHGIVPNEKLRQELLPSMDLMVFPTRHDMSPWAVIEAASAGLPVVATRMGAIPEMVIDGVGGFVCEPGNMNSFADAVQKLVDDEELRRRMGAAVREHIRVDYNPDEQFTGLMRRLKQLAQ